MISEEVIELAHVKWAAPVVLAFKKNGSLYFLRRVPKTDQLQNEVRTRYHEWPNVSSQLKSVPSSQLLPRIEDP